MKGTVDEEIEQFILATVSEKFSGDKINNWKELWPKNALYLRWEMLGYAKEKRSS